MTYRIADRLIDHATDERIQSSLREHLDHDVTVLTVAHRLATICDYDKVVSPSQSVSLYSSLTLATCDADGLRFRTDGEYEAVSNRTNRSLTSFEGRVRCTRSAPV